jgi:hypothetical protein
MESDGIDIRDFYFYPALMDAFDGRFQGQSGQPTHTQVNEKTKNKQKTLRSSLSVTLCSRLCYLMICK